MPINETHNLILTKESKRNLQADKVEKQIDSLLSNRGVNNRSRAVAGWTVVRTTAEMGRSWTCEGEPGSYHAEMFVTVIYNRQDDKPSDSSTLSAICNTIASSMTQVINGQWTLSMVDNEEFEPFDPNNVPIGKDEIGYAPVNMPDNFEDYFSHLIGLDAHIARLKYAINAAIRVDWTSRTHQVLIGPPGCGKTDLCRSLKRALGEEAVMEFDATATTAAGLIKELSEKEILPRVIILEEGEKAADKSLQPFMGLLDDRSEIRKTTARKSVQRDVKVLCIATVNNEDKFRGLESGALASRFSVEEAIYFHRPSRAMLQQILEREVDKIPGGSYDWIGPCLDYCDRKQKDDPRAIIGLLRTGAEGWANGEFVKILEATSRGALDDVNPEEVEEVDFS